MHLFSHHFEVRSNRPAQLGLQMVGDCFAKLRKAANNKYYLPQRNSRVFHRGRRENFMLLCGYFLWLYSVPARP